MLCCICTGSGRASRRRHRCGRRSMLVASGSLAPCKGAAAHHLHTGGRSIAALAFMCLFGQHALNRASLQLPVSIQVDVASPPAPAPAPVLPQELPANLTVEQAQGPGCAKLVQEMCCMLGTLKELSSCAWACSRRWVAGWASAGWVEGSPAGSIALGGTPATPDAGAWQLTSLKAACRRLCLRCCVLNQARSSSTAASLAGCLAS